MDLVQFSEGGELLSIRLASSELDGNNRKKTTVSSVISISLFVIVGSAAFGFWRYRVKHNGIISKDVTKDAWRNDLESQDVSGLTFLDMNTIETATNNFSLSNKLGQGGFGSVYKGKLQDGKEIACFALYYCLDSRRKVEIGWPKRFSIIQGIARGLLYLHRESCLKVIHRDLKVSNILMDEKMNPKISDFGLARMYQGTEHEKNTHRVAGTLGYMAPEYAWTGMFSEKSDIYSFGVLLLEIISGEKISRFGYGEEGKNLLTYAWETWGQNGGINLLDQGIADSCQLLEVERCVQIGLLCVQHQPADRPNTLELLSMLTTTSDLPSPKQPTFVAQTRNKEFVAMGLTTVSKMTDSVILGR
ncbi:G-type lectin S-receptor-like serine/threonine-protein kinase [Raphanus sativus]|nr:G-type lectin S-receptor-like serine/threonine-protein kinase [Raphanus sativus]